MKWLDGKKALVVGVANDKSIASGIAHALHREGAELCLTWQTEKLRSRVEKLASQVDSDFTLELDISNPDHLSALHQAVEQRWGRIDVVVHSVAYAPRNELEGGFTAASTHTGFQQSQDISAWSFVALAQALKPLLLSGSSLITMTYIGAVRAVPNYNVMGVAKASLEAITRYMAADLGARGIRVNAISSGPIRTLAASGIKNFRTMLDKAAAATPLKRNISIEEVGNTAMFLASDLSSGITGSVIYVDGGYHATASV